MSFFEIAWQLFHYPAQLHLPVAAVTGLAYGLPTAEGWWLRADPIQLQIDLAGIYLLGSAHLNLQYTETQELKALLNDFLAQDGLQLYAPDNNAWFIKATVNPEVNSAEPKQIIGKEISAYKMTGNKQDYWQRLLIEIQMLLQQAPVNQRRQARGQPLINSLWLWGAGQLPTAKSVTWRKIWSDDAFIQGLAKLHAVNCDKITTDFAGCFNSMDAAGNYLVTLDVSTQDIEENWLKPILSFLKNDRLKELTVYFANGESYRLTTKQVQPWWKRLLNK